MHSLVALVVPNPSNSMIERRPMAYILLGYVSQVMVTVGSYS